MRSKAAGSNASISLTSDANDGERYIEMELAGRAYAFSGDAEPDDKEIEALLPAAFERMTRYRTNSQVSSKQTVYIDIGNDYLASLPMDGHAFSLVRSVDPEKPYTKISLDRKLLKRILSGP